MPLLREWLVETVGFDAERAQVVAEQLHKGGCTSVQQITSRHRSRSRSSSSGSFLLSELEIELEEWEAVALLCAVQTEACDDDIVSIHAKYKSSTSGWSGASGRESAPLDRAVQDALLIDIFSSSNAEDVLSIAQRLISNQFRVAYKILIELHNLVARLCSQSITQAHELLAGVNVLLPIFTRSLLSHYAPCICVCLQAMTALSHHVANHHRRSLCFPALLLFLEHLPEHEAGVIENALLLLDLLAACPDNLPLLCQVEIHPLSGQACSPPLLPGVLFGLLNRYRAQKEIATLVFPVVTRLCSHHPARQTFQSTEALLAFVATFEGIVEDVQGVEPGLWMLSVLLEDISEDGVGFLLLIRAADVVLKIADYHARESVAVAEHCFHTLCLLLYSPALILSALSHTLLDAIDKVRSLVQDTASRLPMQALFHATRVLQALLRTVRLQASAQISVHTSQAKEPTRLDVEPVFFCTLSSSPQILSTAMTLLQSSFVPLQRYANFQEGDAQVMHEVQTEAVCALQVQSQVLQLCGLLLEGSSVWWCALARDLQTTSICIQGKLYLPHLLSPSPLSSSENPVMLRTLVRLYFLLDQVALQAKRNEDLDLLGEDVLDVTSRVTHALLHLLQDPHLHSAMTENGQEIIPAVGRLLFLFYLSSPLGYVTCAVTCFHLLLQHREAQRSHMRQPRLCQLFSRLLLYFSQVLVVKEDQVNEAYLCLQAILQCLDLLTLHEVHREVLMECGVGKMLVDLLEELDKSSFLPSLQPSIPPLAYSSSSSPASPRLAPANHSPLPLPSSLPDSPAKSSTKSNLPAQLQPFQSTVLRGLAFQCLTHFAMDASSRLFLIRHGLGKLSVLTLLHRGVGNAMLREHVLRLLILFAEDHRMFLGECGLCEALAFLLHHQVPLLHPQAVITEVDETLVHLSCQLMCNLCRDHGENKQRFKKTGIMLWLQVLIGKFHSFIPNPVRMDVKDAINIIKF